MTACRNHRFLKTRFFLVLPFYERLRVFLLVVRRGAGCCFNKSDSSVHEMRVLCRNITRISYLIWAYAKIVFDF